MKLKVLKEKFRTTLNGKFPSEEIQSLFSILSQKFLGYSRFQVSLNSEEIINSEIILKFENALSKLNKNEPIQYILGETEFFSLPFLVNKHTLIPRPETEELVAWVLSDLKIKSLKDLKILDIGTGSGCIAISIAKNLPQACVSGLDISKGAIKIAKENASLNKVSLQFIEQDILTVSDLPKEYDVIVSNPPYVRELEKEKMHQNVLAFEPDSALFVANENPLLFYRKIAKLAKNHLAKDGSLYFEINEYLSDEMLEMLKNQGFASVEVRKDFFKKDRMVKAKL